jgi:ComF family protein
MLNSYIAPILNDYFPNVFSGICLLCQTVTHRQFDLCHACEKELPYLNQACIKCALPLPVNSTQKICGACLQQKNAPKHHVMSPFIYQFPIDRLIMSLKFKKDLAIATVLGQLMAQKMQQFYRNRALPAYIIPVPLHPKRLRERGFNQSLELARPISQHLSIPIDSHSCLRVKHTAPQMRLPATDRASNVRNAFAISKHFNADRVCIIDDVLTTGYTAMALSTALIKAGVHSIDIWCCARASSQEVSS